MSRSVALIGRVSFWTGSIANRAVQSLAHLSFALDPPVNLERVFPVKDGTLRVVITNLVIKLERNELLRGF